LHATLYVNDDRNSEDETSEHNHNPTDNHFATVGRIDVSGEVDIQFINAASDPVDEHELTLGLH
jgi:hypothetical protein